MNYILRKYKYLISDLKSDWNLSDYPVVYLNQSSNKKKISSGRFKLSPWRAVILAWPQLQGSGYTKEEAISDLEKKFKVVKTNKKLPRPGTGMPIVFASDKGVRGYKEIADDFFSKILNQDYSQSFISDESSIWDFVFDDNLEKYYQEIKKVYFVDTSSTNGNFLEIFKKIDSNNQNFLKND